MVQTKLDISEYIFVFPSKKKEYIFLSVKWLIYLQNYFLVWKIYKKKLNVILQIKKINYQFSTLTLLFWKLDMVVIDSKNNVYAIFITTIIYFKLYFLKNLF